MSSNYEVARDYSKRSSLEQGKCFYILLSKMTVKPGDQCLDIGCGTGNPTAIVAGNVGALVFSNLAFHWLDTDEKLKTTKKAFSVVKRNGLFVGSISKERIENAKEILRYFPKERQVYVDDLLSRISLINIIKICLWRQISTLFRLVLK